MPAGDNSVNRQSVTPTPREKDGDDATFYGRLHIHTGRTEQSMPIPTRKCRSSVIRGAETSSVSMTTTYNTKLGGALDAGKEVVDSMRVYPEATRTPMIPSPFRAMRSPRLLRCHAEGPRAGVAGSANVRVPRDALTATYSNKYYMENLLATSKHQDRDHRAAGGNDVLILEEQKPDFSVGLRANAHTS